MKTINKMKKASLLLLFAPLLLSNCTENKKELVAPKEENSQEIITDIILTFVNNANPKDSVVARAKDPDGFGAKPLEILDTINLAASTKYTLKLTIQNNITAESEDVTAEIIKEAHEHQFFYAFTNDAFTSPTGNGNIDIAKDALNYLDLDKNKLPLGLVTEWTTSSGLKKGYFKIKLQHQPDIKGANTGATDGDTDFEIEFILNVNSLK